MFLHNCRHDFFHRVCNQKVSKLWELLVLRKVMPIQEREHRSNKIVMKYCTKDLFRFWQMCFSMATDVFFPRRSQPTKLNFHINMELWTFVYKSFFKSTASLNNPINALYFDLAHFSRSFSAVTKNVFSGFLFPADKFFVVVFLAVFSERLSLCLGSFVVWNCERTDTIFAIFSFF